MGFPRQARTLMQRFQTETFIEPADVPWYSGYKLPILSTDADYLQTQGRRWKHWDIGSHAQVAHEQGVIWNETEVWKEFQNKAGNDRTTPRKDNLTYKCWFKTVLNRLNSSTRHHGEDRPLAPKHF